MSMDALLDVATFTDHTQTGQQIIEAAIEKLGEDAGAIYADDVLSAFAALDAADYARYHAKLKSSRLVVMRDFARALKPHQATDGGQHGRDESMASVIVDFVQSRSTLFIDADKTAYARIRIGEHWEVWPLQSTGFKEWLAAELYKEAGILPKADPIKDAALTLSGMAKFSDQPEQKPVFIRAGLIDGGYAVDLCNDDWQSVIIKAGSWEVDNGQTVAFKRVQNMRPLPKTLATGAGNVDLLFDLVNVPKHQQNMLLAWMLECWRADTAYPVVEIGNTEQGSGKSRAQSTLKMFIDPNKANLRGKPKAAEDIYIAAGNSQLISYENLSHLTEEMQDAFCVLATGGGFAKRQLFSDGEEHTVYAKRPIIMNGVGTLATRQDLIDRLINIELEPLRPEQRKTDTELDAQLSEHAPAIFTGLLDLFAAALAILPTIEIREKARMADFCLLGAAVYAARGVENPAAAFMADYNIMRKEAIYRTLDGSPVAAACMAFLDKNPNGEEFASARNALETLSEYHTIGEAWPKSPKGLSEAIKRLAPAFRQIGIRTEVSKIRNKRGYPVIIKPALPAGNSAKVHQLPPARNPQTTDAAAMA